MREGMCGLSRWVSDCLVFAKWVAYSARSSLKQQLKYHRWYISYAPATEFRLSLPETCAEVFYCIYIKRFANCLNFHDMSCFLSIYSCIWYRGFILTRITAAVNNPSATSLSLFMSLAVYKTKIVWSCYQETRNHKLLHPEMSENLVTDSPF